MKILFFALSIVSCIVLKAQKPFYINGSYLGENANNLSGGIKTSSVYLGMAALQLGFETEKAGWWKNGQFFVFMANTHGASPSENLVGDRQIVSNIDAGSHSYIQELWIKQGFGKVELTVGVQDLNVEFANSEYGSLFSNSSFGILPIISNNISASIFPLTTLGLTVKWKVSDNVTWLNALYDGSPTDFDFNPYNIIWEFISGDGMLAISECQYKTRFNELSGVYKVGAFSHNHLLEKIIGTTLPDSLMKHVFGLYVYGDQEVWVRNNSKVGIFLQFGYSSGEIINSDYYLGMGANFTGLFNAKGRDILGLAMAHEQYTHGFKSETAVELTYQYQFSDHFFVQPEFQYVINPSDWVSI